MSTFSVVFDEQVFVYVRGRLVMKRWLRDGTSVLFQVAPAFTYWSVGSRSTP